jgi:GTP cyclohydrolase II
LISSFEERGVTIKKRVHFIEEEKKERSGEYYLKNKIQKVMTE